MATKKTDEIVMFNENEVYFDLPRKIRYIHIMDEVLQKFTSGSTNWILMVQSRNNAAILANQYIQFLRKTEFNKQRQEKFDVLLDSLSTVFDNSIFEKLKLQKDKKMVETFLDRLERLIELIS